MNDDKKRLKELYTNLKADNYDLPEYGTFESDMADEGLMRQLYDNMKSDNYDLPDFNTFRGDMGYGSYQEPQQVEKAQPKTAVYNPATYAPTVQKQQQDEGVRAPFADAESTRAYDERRKKENFARSSEELGKMAESLQRQSEGMGQRLDAAQEAVRRGTTPGQTHGKEIDPVTGQMRDVWYTQTGEKVATPMEQTIANNPNPLTEEERQALMEANRKQVEDLTKSIDEQLDAAKSRATDKMVNDLNEKYTAFGRAAIMTNTPVASRMLKTPEVLELSAAKRSMENAQRLIAEADHNAKEGKFESSFVAGLGRGFGQKISDPSTWDMGVTDFDDNGAILDALNAWEAGKELTPSQQALLDAKVVELATIEYFSNQVGRGYKAGGVTAESIPFMIEMIMNPLSGTGKGAAKIMAKYALKRFGRSVMKKGLKRGLVKGAGFIGHEAGALGGATGMTFTTGAIRTEADALRRMTGTPTGDYDENGDLHFSGVDKSEVVDESTARTEATLANVLENYSEMFMPEGGLVASKLLSRAAGTKGGKYLGLRAVNNFFTKAGKSNFGRIVTDIERRAQWHGAPEEFFEEIFNGVTNAWLVGDQSIRGKDGKIFGTTDENALFNQDNLIDTGLGVGVMSLAFPFVKTIGYGVEKGVVPSVESYRYKRKLKKTMSAADKAGEQAFGDAWGALRNTLSFGNEDEVKEAVRNVMVSDEYNDEQKKAALRYAVAANGYHAVESMLDGMGQDPNVASMTQNFDAGYEDMTEPQQRRDANIMLADARKTLADMVGEDVMGVIEEDPYGMDVQMQNDQTVSDEVKEAVANYASARAAVDGINQRIEDDADDKADNAREEHSEMVHKDAEGNPDGTVHPVTMKETDENRQPREAYVVDGNIVMRNDGTVDEEASDSQVIVYYPATGERKPVALDDIAEFGDVVTGEAFEQQLEEVRAADVQKAKDAATGKIQEGMELALPDGRPSVVLEIGTEGVKLLNPDDAGKPFNEQQPLVVSVEEAQAMADAWAVAKYKATHPDTAPAQNGNATAAPNPTRKGHKQIERAKKDLAEAEDALVKANAIQNFWTNVDAGAEATEEEKALFDNAKKELEAEGYEIVDMVGKPYFEGTKAISNFVVDESLPTGTKVVRRVIKPQVNKDGKVVQIAELQVAQSMFDDEAEVNEAIEAARGGNADAQATLDRMGIEWREAETAPAEGAEVSDAASTYADLTAKYGDKTGHKIEVTVNDRVADMEKAKKALQTAQAAYDDAPIGKEDNAEAKLAKAQEAYDAAREEWLKWDAVMSEHTAAVAKSKAEEEARRKAENEAVRAKQEAERKAKEEEQARMDAERRERERKEREVAEAMMGIGEQMPEAVADLKELESDPGAMEILNDKEPRTLEEVVARLLADRKVKIDPESYRAHTGYGKNDLKLPFAFAGKDKGGVSMEAFGEKVEESARSMGVKFDERDTNAGFGALLNVLGSVGSYEDVKNYISDNRMREAQAYHQAALSRAAGLAAEEELIMAHGGMTREEYNSYVNWMEDAVEQGKTALTDEEFNQLFNRDYDTRTATTDEGSIERGVEESRTDESEAGQTGVAADDTRRDGEEAEPAAIPVAESSGEREQRLQEERKQRILTEGTSFDKPFGLTPVSETMTAEEIAANVRRIVEGLKQNEGSGDFEGFAYNGNYKKNAGHQVDEYLVSLSGVVPEETLRQWYESEGLKSRDDLRKMGEKLYEETSINDGANGNNGANGVNGERNEHKVGGEAVKTSRRDKALLGAVLDKLREVLGKDRVITKLTEAEKRLINWANARLRSTAPVFYSNAMRAVEGIKQEKATAEQWLAMIQKAGGLKAGEDKWMGLSEWLNDHKGKSITKQEVLDFIRDNQIRMEEVNYGDALFSPNSKVNFESDIERARENGESDESVMEAWDREFDTKMVEAYKNGEFTIDENGKVVYDGQLMMPINDTRRRYTTDFLKNKREIAFVIPNVESWNRYDDVHFGDAGEGRAVMWVRFGETTDKDGKKVLVIDEIQSNRHQEGREKGYKTVNKEEEAEERRLEDNASRTKTEHRNYLRNLAEYYGVEYNHNFGMTPDAADYLKQMITPEEEAKLDELAAAKEQAGMKLSKFRLAHGDSNRNKVPDAPFEKNWHEVAMKRMLRYAAENGYDKVAWTTGEQQAERYNIGNVIDRISVSPLNDRDDYLGVNFAKEIFVKNKNGEDFSLRVTDDGIIRGGDKFNGENVKDVFGKELAEKIMSSDGRVTFEGDNLRIGAEGMKGFYDQILPRFADKYGKKWNVKTTDINLPNIGDNGLTMHSVDVTPEMKESVMEGQPMFHKVFHGSSADFDRFDHSHMGEGEGAQVYGYGTYVTEVEGIGRSYAEKAVKNVSYKGKTGEELGLNDDNLSPEKVAIRRFILDLQRGEKFEKVKAELEKEFEASVNQSLYAYEKYKNPYDKKTADREQEILDYIRSFAENDFKVLTPSVLYTVDIPDDNGHNYLDWVVTILKSDRRRIADVVRRLDGEPAESVKYPKYTDGWQQLADMIERNQWAYQEVRDRLVQAFGGRMADEKRVSDLMHEAGFVGVRYPAEFRSGGRSDGANNYVIFDDGDLKIIDKVKFFRTPSGEVYGFTVGGKIYVDTEIAKADTPIHEYTHMWADMIAETDPEQWEDIKRVFLKDKDVKPLMEIVKQRYPELTADGREEDFLKEVVAHFSGQRGMERLEEAAREYEAEDGNGIISKAKAIAALNKVKEALEKFWGKVAQLFGIRYTNARQVADKAFNDLLQGVDPTKVQRENVANREVDNVILDSKKEKLPQTKEEAIESIPEGGKLCPNDDQGKNIRISRRTVRHSTMHDEKQVIEAFGRIDDIIKNAVKIGDVDVAEDEKGKTNSVGIYYVPVNIDGVQYSARMVIKELINNDMVLDDLSLYHLAMHKEKTPSNTNVGTSNDGLVYSESASDTDNYNDSSEPVSSYKVKQLIHSTQENDQKILGITDKESLRFQKAGGDENPYKAPERRNGESVLEYARRVSESYRAYQERANAGNGGKKGGDTDDIWQDRTIGMEEKMTAAAAGAYERAMARGVTQMKEALQDSMRSLKELYKAILDAEGKKGTNIEEVEGRENAYLAENRMASASNAEVDVWQKDFFKPLVKAVYALTHTSNRDNPRYKALVDYMMAKHGLERNEVMAKRKAKEAFEEEVNAAAREGGKEARAKYDAIRDDTYANIDAGVDDRYTEARKRDYAGLTALFDLNSDEVEKAEMMARAMVESYEKEHGTEKIDELWKRVNAATKASLHKMFTGGLMGIDRYREIRDMYKHYIPLQGFDSTVAEEVYQYMGNDGTLGYGTAIRKAEGRTSKADDPIATISMNAEAAIRKANRNLMKLNFLSFVQNHPSDLVSISDVWLEKGPDGEWKQVNPDDVVGKDYNGSVAEKMQAFEAKMKELADKEPERFKKSRELPNVPYRVLNTRDMMQHQVLVQNGDRQVLMTINGNPRAAQALNGLTNPDVFTEGAFGKVMNWGQAANREISAFYTTRNPEFVLSNFIRDMFYSNAMMWVKEDSNYALNFHKNFGKMANANMGALFVEWETGTIRRKVADGTANEQQKMFYEFMMNGGETGWTSLRDIERHKKDLSKAMMREGNVALKGWKGFWGAMDIANRLIENHARFAAYVTSREMGRSVERSIWDAKEVSVNFNKKGASDKFLSAQGQTILGKTAAVISGLGRGGFVFWNASMQGLNNISRAAVRHPWKFTALATTMIGLGAFAPILAELLVGGDDDDKDSYYNLPEYVRRSNLCFRWSKDMPWITLPLPIEFRAMYGLGELTTGIMTGKERYTDEEAAKQYASQLSQVLPLDFMEGQGGWHAFVPSMVKPLVEANENVSWSGLPIYRADKYDQYGEGGLPQWKRAYGSANQQIVEGTKWLNEKTGGDEVTQGYIDWNPAKIEYMLKGYLGGYFTTMDRITKMVETAQGKRDFEWKNMLGASRVLKEGDERTEARKLTNEYYNLLDEYNETDRRIKAYRKMEREGTMGPVERAHYISLTNFSDEYSHWTVMDDYVKRINRCHKAAKEAKDEKTAEQYKGYENELRRECVLKCREIDKVKKGTE